MPRKRRAINPDKALKMWIAPEWPTRRHDTRGSTVMSSGFSRYVALADKVLGKEAREVEAKAEAETRRAKSDAVVPVTNSVLLNAPNVRDLPPEALLAVVAPKMALPKPPKAPVYPKPPKVTMPKPRRTPAMSKPRRIVYPKPPVSPR